MDELLSYVLVPSWTETRGGSITQRSAFSTAGHKESENTDINTMVGGKEFKAGRESRQGALKKQSI